MRPVVVGYLVAHARLQRERTSIIEVRGEFAFQTKDDVALAAPVIGNIARRVVHKPHPNVAELPRPPRRNTSRSAVRGGRNSFPVGGAERNIVDTHRPIARSLPCGGFFSAGAAHRKAALRQLADSPEHRYRPVRHGRSRAPPSTNSDSTRRHWRTTPWRSRSAARASGRKLC